MSENTTAVLLIIACCICVYIYACAAGNYITRQQYQQVYHERD